MSCKCATYDPDDGRYSCSVSGDGCMYMMPNSKRCAEEYGEGPDVKSEIDIETVAIRGWKGCWQGEENLFKQKVPAGGYVITFHRNLDCLYKVEHYNTIEEIQAKYPQYIWMMPDPRDPSDIVLVGI